MLCRGWQLPMGQRAPVQQVRHAGTWQQHCHEGGGSGRRVSRGEQRQTATGDGGRGCKSVGSCIPPGKGQFVAFK